MKTVLHNSNSDVLISTLDCYIHVFTIPWGNYFAWFKLLFILITQPAWLRSGKIFCFSICWSKEAFWPLLNIIRQRFQVFFFLNTLISSFWKTDTSSSLYHRRCTFLQHKSRCLLQIGSVAFNLQTGPCGAPLRVMITMLMNSCRPKQ